MGQFQFSFLDFFGILAPGIIFFLNSAIFAFSILNLSTKGKLMIQTLQNIEEIRMLMQTSGGGIILSLLLIIICYVIGFILRLIVPDIVDNIASFYLKLISPKKRLIDKYKFMQKLEKEDNFKRLYKNQNELNILKRMQNCKKYLKEIYFPKLLSSSDPLPIWFWSDETYPYSQSTQYIFNRYLPKELSLKFKKVSKHLNKSMYNYFKILIAAQNQAISSMIFQAEGYVRLMCGIFWAFSVGLLSGILLLKTNLLVGAFLVLISVFVLNIILTRFKNQRRREVKLLMDGVIVLSVGKKTP